MRSTCHCDDRVDLASRGSALPAAHRSVNFNHDSTAIIEDRINADAAFVQQRMKKQRQAHRVPVGSGDLRGRGVETDSY